MKYSVLIISICFMLFSCNKPIIKEYKKTVKLSNITTYTGNALVFFQKEKDMKSWQNNVCMILIDEKDSSIFKQSTFNVKRAIQDKCIIGVTFSYDNMLLLHKTNHKNIRRFDICNVPTNYIYYCKCWITYANYYETLKYQHGIPLVVDSCSKRYIIYPYWSADKDKTIKQLVLKVLNIP